MNSQGYTLSQAAIVNLPEGVTMSEYRALGTKLVDIAFNRVVQTQGLLAFTRDDLEEFKFGESPRVHQLCEDMWDQLVRTKPMARVVRRNWHDM
jgi:hypothetical protein